MALVLVITAQECKQCGTVTFPSDRVQRHSDGCNVRNATTYGRQMFVFPVRVAYNDGVNFTIRYERDGRVFWRQLQWQ